MERRCLRQGFVRLRSVRRHIRRSIVSDVTYTFLSFHQELEQCGIFSQGKCLERIFDQLSLLADKPNCDLTLELIHMLYNNLLVSEMLNNAEFFVRHRFARERRSSSDRAISSRISSYLCLCPVVESIWRLSKIGSPLADWTIPSKNSSLHGTVDAKETHSHDLRLAGNRISRLSRSNSGHCRTRNKLRTLRK